MKLKNLNKNYNKKNNKKKQKQKKEQKLKKKEWHQQKQNFFLYFFFCNENVFSTEQSQEKQKRNISDTPLQRTKITDSASPDAKNKEVSQDQRIQTKKKNK